jgi:FAD/FMN-containing dehydrogenase
VSLPFARLAEFAARVGPVVEQHAPGARTVVFGHLGDGNLHVNVLGPDPADPTVDDAVLDLAVALGGSISAEHGIGVAKRAALARSTPAGELHAERAVKAALDPAGLLNPGVIFA